MSVLAKNESEESEAATLVIDEVEIGSLEELREYFQLEEMVEAFQNGSLEQWLQYMFYEEQAAEVRALSKEDKNAGKKLCDIFGVPYEEAADEYTEEEEIYEYRRAMIEQYTQDETVLANVSVVALNQQELAKLLRENVTTIYLCHGKFSIPLAVENVHYIGVDRPVINSSFTMEEYTKAGITLENIELPEKEETVSKESVSEASGEEQEYDDFSEYHTAFCTAFHNRLKAGPFLDFVLLPQPKALSCMEFKSKSECILARNACIKKVYRQAENYMKPGHDSCVAKKQAKEYSEVIMNCFTPVMDILEFYCRTANQETLYKKLRDFIDKSEEQLLRLFEQEFYDNEDYYHMYKMSYFIDKVEIEENDYRISDEDEPFFRFIETVFANNIEYSFSPFEAIYEMDKDLSGYLFTFSKAVQGEYQKYVAQIEHLLQEIGIVDDSPKENESFYDYVRRICTRKAS